jgi:hypothetical protein
LAFRALKDARLDDFAKMKRLPLKDYDAVLYRTPGEGVANVALNALAYTLSCYSSVKRSIGGMKSRLREKIHDNNLIVQSSTRSTDDMSLDQRDRLDESRFAATEERIRRVEGKMAGYQKRLRAVCVCFEAKERVFYLLKEQLAIATSMAPGHDVDHLISSIRKNIRLMSNEMVPVSKYGIKLQRKIDDTVKSRERKRDWIRHLHDLSRKEKV